MPWSDKHGLAVRRRAAAIGALPPSLQWNFTPDDAAALQDSVLGHVTIPSGDNYPSARQVFSRAFEKFPQMIVRCEVAGDVVHALEFARHHELVPTCRSGGHSTAGFSVNDGLVIDVGGLDSITVDRSAGTITIGAGATFGHINSTLDSFGVHIPGGSCDGVGLGGYVQGGGYGYTSLMYGMNIDQAVGATVLTAERGIVQCSDSTYADLFWAIRGGGACGSFGILLDVTFGVLELGPVTGYALCWPLEQAGEAMALMQSDFTGSAVPDGLGYQNTAGFVAGERVLLSLGMYRGTPDECRTAIGPLLASGDPQVEVADTSGTYTDAMAWIENQFAPGIPNVAIHTPTIADSRYITSPIGVEGWSQIMDLISVAPDQVTFLGLEPYGGPITDVAADQTAFVHRNPGFDVYVWVFWTNDEQKAHAEAFLETYRRLMADLGDGSAYQNYPAADNDAYLEMYYGSNLGRLQQIKAEWDPNSVFQYGQTIPVLEG